MAMLVRKGFEDFFVCSISCLKFNLLCVSCESLSGSCQTNRRISIAVQFPLLWSLRVASPAVNRLVGLVVKASASRAEDPGFESRLRRDFFSGSSHTSDLKSGTPVATLPGAWRYKVGAGTGRCQYTVTG